MSDPTMGQQIGDEARRQARNNAPVAQQDVAVTLANVRPFRLSTMAEMILARKVIMQTTGLQPGGFSENPWGFPFMPYPMPNTSQVQGTVRMVPPGLRYQYIGHPIFWIDPALTRPTETEQSDPVRWNVRMFYLLMGFGLMNPETLAWYNAPRSKGVSYSEADYQNFMQDHPSALDRVIFTEQDLLIPLAQINASANDALYKIGQMQESERQRFTALQRGAVQDANRLLADQTQWNRLEAEAVALTYRVSQASLNGEAVSVYFNDAYAIKNRVVEYLSSIESVVMVLSAPVLRNQAYTTSMFSKILSLTKTFEENVINGKYDQSLSAVLSHMFERGGFPEDSPTQTVFQQVAAQHRHTAMERLGLALTNFARTEHGRQIYGSVDEKRVFEQIDEPLT